MLLYHTYDFISEHRLERNINLMSSNLEKTINLETEVLFKFYLWMHKVWYSKLQLGDVQGFDESVKNK